MNKRPEKVQIIFDEVIKISPEDRIAGAPAAAVIKLLKVLSQGEISTRQALGISIKGLDVNVELLRRLVSEERLLQVDKKNTWTLTEKGFLYSKAQLTKIKRTTAAGIIKEIPSSADRINADDELAYRVERLAIFGSYLSDKDRIGDVDIAADLIPRLADKNEQYNLLMSRAESGGKRISSPVHKSAYASNEVWSALKCGRKSVSVHSYNDLYATGCAFRTLYISRRLVNSAVALKKFFDRAIKPKHSGMKSPLDMTEEFIGSAMFSVVEFASSHSDLQRSGMLRAVGHQLTLQDWPHYQPTLGLLALLAAAKHEPYFSLNEHLIELVMNKMGTADKEHQRTPIREKK